MLQASQPNSVLSLASIAARFAAPAIVAGLDAVEKPITMAINDWTGTPSVPIFVIRASSAADYDISGSPRAEELGTQIIDGLKSRLADVWSSRFTAQHRQIAEDVAADGADVVGMALAGEDYAEAKREVEAQLANITAFDQANLVNAFWASAGDVVMKAIPFAFKLIV